MSIMQKGSWAVLGKEIECVLLHLLLSVPSIAFDHSILHVCSNQVMPQTTESGQSRRNRPRTANVNQYAVTNYNKRITVLIRVEGVCRHL